MTQTLVCYQHCFHQKSKTQRHTSCYEVVESQSLEVFKKRVDIALQDMVV